MTASGGVPSPRRWTLWRASRRWFAAPGPRTVVGADESVLTMPVAEHEEALGHYRRAVDIAEQEWAAAEAELARLRDAAQAVVDADAARHGAKRFYAIQALRAVLSSGAASQGEEG